MLEGERHLALPGVPAGIVDAQRGPGGDLLDESRVVLVEGVERDLPVLLAWGPYGKHALSNQVFWPRSGVNPEWLSPLTPFEGPDPVWWGQHGYAVAIVDPRGACLM